MMAIAALGGAPALTGMYPKAAQHLWSRPRLAEFFLLLSSTGLAYLRCQLDRVNGGEISVSFLRQRDKRKKPMPFSSSIIKTA